MASNSGSLNVEIKVKDGVSKPIADAEKAVGKLEQSFNNLNNSVKTLEKVRSALNGIREVDKLSFGSKESIRDVEKMITILAKYEKALVAHQKGSKKLSDDQFGLLTDQATRYAKSLQEIGAAAQKMQGEIAKAGDQAKKIFNNNDVPFLRAISTASQKAQEDLEKLKKKEETLMNPQNKDVSSNKAFKWWQEELQKTRDEIKRTEAQLNALKIASESLRPSSLSTPTTGIWAQGQQTTKQNELLSRQAAIRQELQKREAEEKRLAQIEKERQAAAKQRAKEEAQAENQRVRNLQEAQARLNVVISLYNRLMELAGRSNKSGLALSDDAKQLLETLREARRVYNGIIANKGRAFEGKNVLDVAGYHGFKFETNRVYREQASALREHEKAQQRAAQAADKHAQSQMKLSQSMQKTNDAAASLKRIMQNIFPLMGLRQTLLGIIEIGGEFQKQHMALQSIVGDVGQANALFENLKTLSIDSPFTFLDFSKSAKQLAAFSTPYNELYDTTRRLADVSAGLGVDMSRLIYAYGQTRSTEALNAKELRMFAYAGIPMLKMLSQQLSEVEGRAVSTGETFKRITQREIGFESVKKVFEDLTNEGGMFFEMQGTLMESLWGKWMKMLDVLQLFQSEVADSPVGSIMGVFIDSMTAALRHTSELVTAGFALITSWAMMKVSGAALTKMFGAQTLTVMKNTQISNVYDKAILKRTVSMSALTQAERIHTISQKSEYSNAVKNFTLSKKINYSSLQQLLTKQRLTTAEYKHISAITGLNIAQLRLIATGSRLTATQLRQLVKEGHLTKERALLMFATKRLTEAEMMSIRSALGLSAAQIKSISTLGVWRRGILAAELSLKGLWMSLKTLTASFWPFLAVTAVFEGVMYVWNSMTEKSEKLEEAARNAAEAYKNIMDTQDKIRIGGSSLLEIEKDPQITISTVVKNTDTNSLLGAIDQISEELKSRLGSAYDAIVQNELNKIILANQEDYRKSLEQQVELLDHKLRVLKDIKAWESNSEGFDYMEEANDDADFSDEMRKLKNAKKEVQNILTYYSPDFDKIFDTVVQRYQNVFKDKNGEIVEDASKRFNLLFEKMLEGGEENKDAFAAWNLVKTLIPGEIVNESRYDTDMLYDLANNIGNAKAAAKSFVADIEEWVKKNAAETMKFSEDRKQWSLTEKAMIEIQARYAGFAETYNISPTEAALILNGEAEAKLGIKMIPEKVDPVWQPNYWQSRAQNVLKDVEERYNLTTFIKKDVDYINFIEDIKKEFDNLNKEVQTQVGERMVVEMGIDIEPKMSADALKKVLDKLNGVINSKPNKPELAEAAETLKSRIAPMYSIALLMEDAGISLYDKNDNNKNRGGSGSKTDKWLQNFKKEISLFEKYVQAYEKLVKAYGEARARVELNKLEEFASIRDKGYDPAKPAEAFRKMAQNPNLTTTKERQQVKAEVEIKAENAETDEAIEQITSAVDEFNKAIEKNTKAWDKYNKLLSASGSQQIASQLAFGSAKLPSSNIENAKSALENILPDEWKFRIDELQKMDSTERKNTIGEEKNKAFESYLKLVEKEDEKQLDLIIKALESAKTRDKKISNSNQQYDDAIKAINAKVEKKEITKDEAKTLIDDQEKARKQRNAKIEWDAFINDDSGNYAKVFGNLDHASKSAIENLYKEMLNKRDVVKDDSSSYKALIEALEKLRLELEERNPYQAASLGFSGFKAIRDVKKNGGKISNETQALVFGKKVNDTVADGDYDTAFHGVLASFSGGIEGIAQQFADLQDILNPVIELFDQLGHTDMGEILGTGSKAFGAASGVASGMSSFSGLFKDSSKAGMKKVGNILGNLGPYAAMAGFALSLTTSILALHDKAIQKEIDASKQRQKEMDTLSKNLKKDLEDTLGGIFKYSASSTDMNKIKANWDNLSSSTKNQFNEAQREGNNYFDASLTSLMAQRDEAERQLELEKSKKKKDGSAIKDAEQSLRELDNEVKNFAKDLADSLYGIDFKDWAGKLADALTDAWMSGENAALAYKNTVANILKELGVSVMTQKILEPLLEPLMGRFFNQFEADNGKLTDKGMHIIGEMYNLGNKAKDGVYAYLDGLDQIDKQHGGNGLRESSASSLSSGIKSITEETAGLLASYVNSIRADVAVLRTLTEKQQIVLDSLPELNVIARSQLTQLNNIATFTRRSAEATEEIRTTLGRITYASTNGYKVRI